MVQETLSDGLVNIIRGCTRPFCTVWGLVTLSLMIVNDIEIPAYFIGFVSLMLTTWFGEKTVNRLKGK